MKAALPALLAALALALLPARADDWTRTEAACHTAFQSMKPGMGGIVLQLRRDAAEYSLLSGAQVRPGVPNETIVLRFGQGLSYLGKKQNIRFTPLPGQLGTVGFLVETGIVFGGLGSAAAPDRGIVLAQPGASVRFVPPDMGKAAAALKMPKAN